MAKPFKVMEMHVGTPTSHEKVMDWKKCILCQKHSTEALKCPAETKRETEGAGYKTLANNLLGFKEIGCLPPTIPLSCLDDGDGIENTLVKHKARWHDSCRLQYNKTELQRAR